MTECIICGRRVEEEGNLCEYHIEALDHVRRSFEDWQRALGVGWKEYLSALLNEEDAGKWVLEVVEHLIQQDGSLV